MRVFGKTPSVFSRFWRFAGLASPAVLALAGAWATGGLGRGSVPGPTALDQLAVAVAALDGRDGRGSAPLAGFMSFSASAAPRAAEPPQPRHVLPSTAPAAAPRSAPGAPRASIESAMRNSLAWIALREVRATEDRLAQLVRASTAAAAAAEATRHARAQIARYGPTAATAAARPAGAPEPPGLSPCAARLRAVAARGRLRFSPGATRLDTRGRAFATVIGYMAARCPRATVVIEGVADPTGDPADNARIARARAENARAEVLRALRDPARVTLRARVAAPGRRAGGAHRFSEDRRVDFRIEDSAAPLPPRSEAAQ